ncbi:hypothetical protein [Streptomyces inhibens]|uniref:hypothetical protein n=1 Tax=Streptomyces inhibens TaxID=2293571 RepID=UPI001EE6C3A0|nr:hypothetical protein [Streptomyces inhibens]UKY48155.1 hypothetical protein KI385_04555 [Streptomyces inhibens]
MNAWTAQQRDDYGALSTALCLCVCAAGLFGEDLVQRGYRRDRAILAHIARRPGAAPDTSPALSALPSVPWLATSTGSSRTARQTKDIHL